MKKIFISMLGFLVLAPVMASAQLAPGKDGLVRPPGIESSSECMKQGGTWTPNTFDNGKSVGTYNPYECGFTPAQYSKEFNVPMPATPTGGTPIGSENTFCTGGSCTYVPLEPLPGFSNCYGPNCATIGKTDGSFANLIGSSFKLLIGGGAVIAVVMIVLGALTYMFSDIVGNKKKALDRIRGAMWAIVLLVSSYLILVTINPDLVKFNLNLNAANNFNPTPNIANPASNAAAPPTNDQLAQCINQGSGTAVYNVKFNPDNSWFCQRVN